ncbi:SDR family NAD(P)-dependent oxidoreductase [Actinomadura barringtoniae]|uniref:SDR family NAD(P)-dependent oxidoreductase n=1 Tax=Actinomadura barringtoniae TaxID=1427535 RepID=A0A939PAC5_9ACTN|nr:SDR family NAD(P)-dependent oxidoreductase [Actinomadura barringtoniae]MBO2449112.1 SDR family NAD(P)-dependent oxidoreductase [Actinomadura barringtoniae]
MTPAPTPVSEQTILITGATDGLGRGLARTLAAQGAALILHGRNEAKGAALLAELRDETGNDRLSFERADFASLAEIRDLGERVAARDRLDVLVNNAGMGVELARQDSADGLELTFQVDYLATYVLSGMLTPLLARSAPARVVNVSSAGQAPLDFDDVMLERGWDGVQAYCQAKLAQIMLTVEHAEVLRGAGVTVNALHPASYMPTKIVTQLFSVQSTLEEGVENTARLVTDPGLAGVTGVYFNRSREARANNQAYDAKARARLLELSERLTGVAFPRGSLTAG